MLLSNISISSSHFSVVFLFYFTLFYTSFFLLLFITFSFHHPPFLSPYINLTVCLHRPSSYLSVSFSLQHSSQSLPPSSYLIPYPPPSPIPPHLSSFFFIFIYSFSSFLFFLSSISSRLPHLIFLLSLPSFLLLSFLSSLSVGPVVNNPWLRIFEWDKNFEPTGKQGEVVIRTNTSRYRTNYLLWQCYFKKNSRNDKRIFKYQNKKIFDTYVTLHSLIFFHSFDEKN